MAVIPLRRDQGKLSPEPEFETIDPGEWQGREPPRREWMVDGFFPRRNVSIVSGAGKIGKSLLMQQLCTCAVMGCYWLGCRVEPGRAVYFGCEDDKDELWARQADINRHYACEMADLGDAGLTLAARVDKNNLLGQVDRATWSISHTPLYKVLLERCRDIGATYLVIDTLTKTFGGNLNDPRHASEFIGLLRRAAILLNGAVILVMHPSVAGRANGSGEAGNSQWFNCVRSFCYLRNLPRDGLMLEHMAGNYGPKAKPIPLEWHKGVFRIRETQGQMPYRDD